MSKLIKGLTLAIVLIALCGCSVKKETKNDSIVINAKQEIKESKPVKLKPITPQDKRKINAEKNPNKHIQRALSEPLELNQKIQDLYLLQLKAIEFMIKNLE